MALKITLDPYKDVFVVAPMEFPPKKKFSGGALFNVDKRPERALNADFKVFKKRGCSRN